MRVADLLAPVPLERFRRDYVGRAPLHCPGPADRFADVFGWSALEALINTGPMPHPALRLYRSDVGFVPTATGPEAIRALRDGAAVVVEDADAWDPGLAALVESVSAELDEPARANVYATTPTAPGFPLHADTHDVFVLHVAGTKRWRVCGPSLVDPLFHPSLHPQTPPEDTTPTLEVTLSPGDTLYIPRGHWHEALAEDGPSLHVTLAVFFATGVDVLRHLLDVLHASPAVRAAFPMAVGPAWRARDDIPDDHRAHLARVRAAMDAALADPSLLAGFRAARLAGRSLRRPFALPAHLWDVAPDGVYARPSYAARVATTADGVELTIPGRTLVLPAGSGPLVRRMAAEPTFTVEDLVAAAPGLGREAVTIIVRHLVAEGVIRPCGPGPVRA